MPSCTMDVVHDRHVMGLFMPRNDRLLLMLLLGAGLLAGWVPLRAYSEPIRVKDQRGHLLELSAPAERIVTIPIPMAAVVMALDGSSRRLVAMHPTALKSIQEGFLKRVFPEALSIRSDIVRGGQFNPNVESVLELRPDLVVQWTQPEVLIKTLERAGLRVAGLINSPPTQAINERNLTIMAELIGRKNRVRTLLATHHEVHGKIEAISKTIPTRDRPRVLYLRSMTRSMRPAGAHTYNDFWIQLAGGVNVAAATLKGLRAAVNDEQLVVWNPEVVFLGAFDHATPDDFLRNPVLAQVEAVKNRRVYKMPHGGYRWDPGSHESHLTWQWVAQLLHPQRFDFDLRAAMAESYRFLYRYELADREIDDILQMQVNGEMTGYDRFKK